MPKCNAKCNAKNCMWIYYVLSIYVISEAINQTYVTPLLVTSRVTPRNPVLENALIIKKDKLSL